MRYSASLHWSARLLRGSAPLRWVVALRLPERGRWHAKHHQEKQRLLRMEFRTFVNAFIKIPCQLIRAGRQLVYRVLHYHPHLPLFFRLCAALRC